METIPQKAPGDKNLPSLEDLVKDSDMSLQENKLMILLNQPPPEAWIERHPTATIKQVQEDGTTKEVKLPFIPIQKIEWLLTKIFGGFGCEVRDTRMIANSVVVTVRVYVINPLTGKEEWQDGIGAAPVQTDKGAGAIDWDHIKYNGVQIAAPAAESYAFKDAAEKFGKLFGRDISRKEQTSYDGLLKPDYDWESLDALFKAKEDSIPHDEIDGIRRIIFNKEKTSFKKTFDFLKAL